MTWFNDLSIRNKLLLSFCVIALMTLAIAVVGINGMNMMQEHSREMYEQNTVALSDLENITEHFQRMRNNALELMIESDRARQVETNRNIDERIAAQKESGEAYMKRVDSEEERVAYRAYAEDLDRFLAAIGQMRQLSLNNQKDQAVRLWFGEADDLRTSVQEHMDSLVAVNLKHTASLYQEQQEYAATAAQYVLIIGLTALVLVIDLAYFTVRAINRPLVQLVAQAGKVADGDLTVSMDYASKDEIGMLAQTFRKMTENLKTSITQIVEATAAVASATTEISTSTEQMAAGAQQQSNQAADVSAAIEEMSKTIFENSRSTSLTSSTAATAKEAAQKGGQVVEQTIAGMKEIASVVRQSAETVKALGQSSNQIGEITSVIDDIADQTNLLALNAAIEAARAGDHGRGFAVVADEVRKLAERTSKATKEIAEMIKRIQSDTTIAVASMKEGTQKVESGIQMADAAGKSLNDIVDISQKVTDMVSSIAAASEQQAGASEEISKSMEGISSVTHETAAGIQQIARSSEDLNRLTENLQVLTQRFRISMSDDRDLSSYLNEHQLGLAARGKRTPKVTSPHKPTNGNGGRKTNGHDNELKQSAMVPPSSVHGSQDIIYS